MPLETNLSQNLNVCYDQDELKKYQIKYYHSYNKQWIKTSKLHNTSHEVILLLYISQHWRKKK